MERKRVRESYDVPKIQTLDDLITYAESFPSKRSRNAEAKNYRGLVRPLEHLRDLVGMEDVKQSILSQILYFLQGLHDGKLDMLHTVIQGPPGVGKTELARILGDIYTSMGILRSSKFVIARRSDLIGKYLGHTADKTQTIINKSRGGVLLIDEAYSLGNGGEGDSFSKECLDTLNQNLTENKHNFMCIIAGYEKSLNECFFAANEGLQRRFTFRYTLRPYTAQQLHEIFVKMVGREKWELSSDVSSSFFENHIKDFPNSAGDMETLLFQSKLCHASRLMTDSSAKMRVMTLQDVGSGFKNMSKSQGNVDVSKMMMYL